MLIYTELRDGLMRVDLRKNQSIIWVVGFDMANMPGVAGSIFDNLGKANININAIAQGLSEINISFAVHGKSADLDLKLIHNAMFENKQINCFIAGGGVVGSAIIRVLEMQKEYFSKKGYDVNIVGIFDGRKFLLMVSMRNIVQLMKYFHCLIVGQKLI